MWPEIYALFSPDYAQKSDPGVNFYDVTMIEPYYSMSVEQKARKFSLIGPDYWVVPFLKYALWKHKVAKAANLWVKLHMNPSKKSKPTGLRGATQSVCGCSLQDVAGNVKQIKLRGCASKFREGK
jgi:hypothetical protein